MLSRLMVTFAGLSLALASSHSTAQSTTLKLTTVQQTNCVAVTDSQGVHLEPGGSALAATGVQLSGDGCGSQVSDFDANVSVPATAVAGQNFTVTWSAAAAATRCVYAGTQGATGWPVGATACQGSACAGSHSATVNAPTAGSRVFSIACTNDSGYAEKSMAISAPALPPQPVSFALTPTPPAGGYAVATPFTVAWSVTGATSCTGSASLNGSSASLPGWSDTTTTSSPRTVTPPQAGNWTLKLVCSNAVGNATSLESAITVSASGTSCPAGRQTAVKVCYNANLSTCFDVSGDMKFDEVWGRVNPGSPLQAFPAQARLLTFKDFDKTKYLSVEIPAAQLPGLVQQGKFWHGETNAGPNLSMSISTACGDFAPPDPYCSYTNIGAGGRIATYSLGASPVWGCKIENNQRYFLNFKVTTPSAPHVDCSGNSCKIAVQNTPPIS